MPATRKIPSARHLATVLAPILAPILVLIPVLAALAFLAGPVTAQEKLPLPRFASLQSAKVNMRTGPGEAYPILWTYQRANLPVEIIEEFELWRRIRDHDGIVGWVKGTLLSGKRHAMVRDQRRTLRAEAKNDAPAVAYLEPGVILRILECSGEWCRLKVQDHKGWLMKNEFWGVYAEETLKE
ncbi:SH3-like domain-containing protein [Dongia mobilis]|uniref:SH3-like domain-containing protein n=1 Tax=Dongia mobilis TaxID=578943 RepID=A0A4R6WX37_9PROT|nr:SH3 domain-containing protein [Dongia mobilis]TDQ86364.1 SH3-like domain-containing protein [Dongia mobilis]